MRRVVVAALAAALAVAVLRHRARWPSRTAQARADGFSAGAVAERMRAESRRVDVESVNIGGDGSVTIIGRLPAGTLGIADAWGADFSVGYSWPSTGRTPFRRIGDIPEETATVLGISTPDDPARVPTLAELRSLRGWNSGAGWKPGDDLEKELDSVEWWEMTWPEPDRLGDEQDGANER